MSAGYGSTPRVTVRPFGSLPSGQAIELYSIKGALELHALTLGGIITSLRTPDREGRFSDVVLGHASLAPYLDNRPYLGAVIGRYANRIANGRFAIDGTAHQLAINDRPHHLHGGWQGFDKQVWDASPIATADAAGVVFTRVSPSGEEGYPGTLHVTARYLVTRGARIVINYEAVTDATTVVNLTQHTYFNLAGQESTTVLGHELVIEADEYTPTDRTRIARGHVAPVEGTVFDFRLPTQLHTRPQGFDHNFVLRQSGPGVLHRAAALYDPSSGRALEIRTTEPGLQFYEGQLLDHRAGAHDRSFGPYAGLCLETQHFPDSPNRPRFPSTVLRVGERYTSTTAWHFSTR